MWPKSWIIKSLAINLISRLPFCEQIHFWGQKLLGKHRLDASEMYSRALELFRLVHHVGVSLRDKTILEIGTGWFPFVPLLSHLAGARKVITVDIHPWLTLHNTERTVKALEAFLDGFAHHIGQDADDLRVCYRDVRQNLEKSGTLQEFFESINVSYICPCDITRHPIEAESADIVFSSNVLEHIEPDLLLRIHRRTGELMNPDGLAVHRFNPGDHRQAGTGLSINFLRYPESTWRFLGGTGLAYENRLRSCEHAELVRKAGLKLQLWADALDQSSLEALKTGGVDLAPRFRYISQEYLCAFYSWFVVRPNSCYASLKEPIRVKWIDELLSDKPAPAGPGVACDTGDARASVQRL